MHSKRYYTCVTMYILICTEAEPTSASDTTGIIAGVVAVLILIIGGIVIAVVVAVVIM